MATDIGKAFVQIVPSAKGIGNAISEQLKGESESAGTESGHGIANAIKKVFATAAIGETLKQTVMEGAKLEQSFGGLDTLYGEAAGQMKVMATEAAAAGISANSYAEQAVSFGAALKQSFAGAADAEKLAGEAANTAIMDMADNAAKMGTDIGSIQTAYQGFAKQNYTMLDNLKLGYGGTKQEMQRLLKDAEKLTGVKYDINNLSDVYSAIHVIQGELGITGVAALEAQTTISGSFGAMKASLQNFMANLTLGSEMGPYFESLVSSVITFAGNIIPAVMNIFTGLGDVIVNSALPMASGWISSLAEGMSTGIPVLMSNIMELVQNIVEVIGDNLPMFITKGVEILTNLIQGLASAAPSVFSTIGNILQTIWNAVKQIDWLGLGGSIISALASGIGSLAGIAIAAMAKIAKEVWNAIKNTNWLELGANIVNGLVNGIRSGIGAVVSAAKELATSAWNTVKDILGISSPSKVFMYLGKMTDQGLAEGISSNSGVVQDAMNDITDNMISSFAPDLSAGLSLRGNISSSRNQASGFTQIINNYSPKELSPSEVARQTRNATKQMALKLSMGG